MPHLAISSEVKEVATLRVGLRGFILCLHTSCGDLKGPCVCGGVGGGEGEGREGKGRERWGGEKEGRGREGCEENNFQKLSMKARVYMCQPSLSTAAVWFTCTNGGSLSLSSFPPLLPSVAVSVLQDRDRPIVRLVSCLL